MENTTIDQQQLQAKQNELFDLENKFNAVSDWLLTNNILHPDFQNKIDEFNKLDEAIFNLITAINEIQ